MPGIRRLKNEFTLSGFVSIQETILVQTNDPLKLADVKIMFKIKNIESQEKVWQKKKKKEFMPFCKVGLTIPSYALKNIWVVSAQRSVNGLTMSPGLVSTIRICSLLSNHNLDFFI